MISIIRIRKMGGKIEPLSKTKNEKCFNSWNHIFCKKRINEDIKIEDEFLYFDNFIKWYELNKYRTSNPNDPIQLYSIDGNYKKESLIFLPKSLILVISKNRKPVKGVSYNKTRGFYSTKIYDRIENKKTWYYSEDKNKCIDIYIKETSKMRLKLLESYKDIIPDDVYNKVYNIISDKNFIKIK